MAWLAGQQGDTERQIDLNRQALSALAQIGAWLDAVTVLGNLSTVMDETESRACLAQAHWISLRAEIPAMKALDLCDKLIQKTGGPQVAHAPLLVGAMIFFLKLLGQNHPNAKN